MFGLNMLNAQETVKDIDGNEYKTVKIGNQWWMAENLKTTKYNDGIAIPKVTDQVEWGDAITPGYCWYNNDITKYKATYGALYNWFTINTGKLCPTGWHVPTNAEWSTLTTYLGGNKVAGGKLKSTTGHWNGSNLGADNSSGFTALPGGHRHKHARFYDMGNIGYWWSATSSGPSISWFRLDSIYASSRLSSSTTFGTGGISVRCLKD